MEDTNASNTNDFDGFLNFQTFLSFHRQQLIGSGVPESLWNSLFNKLRHGVFDAGEHFQIVRVEEESREDLKDGKPTWKVIVIDEHGIDVNNPQHVYLIDHAWTYRLESARTQLSQIPNLLERMAALMDVDQDQDRLLMTERVLEEMWRYNQTYSVGCSTASVEEVQPIWYIMDEFGSKIQHSDEATFRAVPFFYVFDRASYSLLFPVANVPNHGEVTRNFVEGPEQDRLVRKALKIPWERATLTDVDYRVHDAGDEFYASYRLNETLPNVSEEPPQPPLSAPLVSKLKVYSEYLPIRDNLKHPAFVLVDSEDEGDILWLTTHFKDFRGLSERSPGKFINQFPCENVLTIKDLLSGVCRRAAAAPSVAEDGLELDLKRNSSPKWFPTTFNLKTELPQFVSYFQHRENGGLDNHWICKPWNLARSLDTYITDNLNCVVRLPMTGPKIACKYVEDPVLFHVEEVGAVKFDIRYIVLLTSVRPLKVYVYERFWLRFANKPFSLDCLDDYEKHFTVMNYRNTTLKQMFCHDFVEMFEKQNPDVKYEDVERGIDSCLREVFEAACSAAPPRGLGTSPQSRAAYGVDIMLKWDTRDHDDGSRCVQPVLLEINWAPDCRRACQYYPEFFDDIFSVLFLDETHGKHVRLL